MLSSVTAVENYGFLLGFQMLSQLTYLESVDSKGG